MKTLIVADVASGSILDRVTLDGDRGFQYATGMARAMFEGPAIGDLSPDQIFREREGWSNGYVRTSAIIDPEQLPAIPGLREQVEGSLTAARSPSALAARASIAAAVLGSTEVHERRE